MLRDSQLVYVMAALAFLQGVFALRLAIAASSRSASGNALQRTNDASEQSRIERADDDRERVSPAARYVASAVGFGMVGVLLTHLVTPAAAYAILCLALVGRCVVEQILEERAPRRRSALIGRSRSMDPVLVTWIALTATTSLVLIPWLLDEAYRTAAVIVTICVLTMVVVAWRVASAPPLLFGNDVEAEQVVDRETRAIRTGNTCILTVGSVAIFVGFIGGTPPFINHHVIVWAMILLWVLLLTWRSIYTRRVSQTPLAS